MEKRPFDLSVFQQEQAHLVIASYTEDPDPVLDKVAADAALDLKVLLTSAGYAPANGGYRETSTTTGLVSASGTTTILLTMLALWEGAGPTKRILPVVYFKGVAVPYVGLGGANGITGWDGLTSAKTITIDNASAKYSAVAADYEVTLLGDIVGQLESIDAGGVTLAYTTNKFKSLGYREETVTQTIQEGKQCTGSFVFWEAFNVFRNGATVHNVPGEDLEAAIFGTQWAAGVQNELTYNAKPFAISILKFTGNPLNSTPKAGAVFALESRIYGCTLNNVPNPANVAQGGNEPFKKQYDFTSKWGVYKKVHLVTT